MVCARSAVESLSDGTRKVETIRRKSTLRLQVRTSRTENFYRSIASILHLYREPDDFALQSDSHSIRVRQRDFVCSISPEQTLETECWSWRISDLVQIKDDGTHAILPVTRRTDVQPDHARVPVMMLRHSDGKLRRDGSRAALWQPDHPVDERGRVHGAPGLAGVVEYRGRACIRGPCRHRGDERQWVRTRKKLDRLRGQDKSRKVRTVG
jgi:hypothetical protein